MDKLPIPELPEGMEQNVESGVKIFKTAKSLFEQFSGDGGAGGAQAEGGEFADFEQMLLLDDTTELNKRRNLKFIGGETAAEF